MRDVKKIGVLVGREWSFPPAFLDEVNGRDAGVIAEYVTLGGSYMNEPVEYDVIIDRISHEIPYYRAYLKNTVLQGTYVINNPFRWGADDKYFAACLADRFGAPSPRTVVLPMKQYPQGVVDESLRNLAYPLDWNAIFAYVGQPAILKDAWDGRHPIYKVNTVDELIRAYDKTGTRCMVVQEFIEWDQFVRCICIGQKTIMPIKYDPNEQLYLVEHDYLAPETNEKVVEYARILNRALGYDMNSVEFAIRDGIPYAIDFMNAVPDLDINSITPHYFEWVVKAMADFCIEMALNPRPQRSELHWAQHLP